MPSGLIRSRAPHVHTATTPITSRRMIQSARRGRAGRRISSTTMGAPRVRSPAAETHDADEEAAEDSFRADDHARHRGDHEPQRTAQLERTEAALAPPRERGDRGAEPREEEERAKHESDLEREALHHAIEPRILGENA